MLEGQGIGKGAKYFGKDIRGKQINVGCSTNIHHGMPLAVKHC
jgi:hypothetical protein